MKQPISQILSEKGHIVHSVEPTDTVQKAAEKMTEFNIGALIVIESDQMLGILSERDLLNKVITKKLDTQTLRVSDIMTAKPITINMDTTVEVAMHIMTEKRIRHLPVIYDNALVGIITIGDLTRWAIRDQQEQISDLMRYITGT